MSIDLLALARRHRPVLFLDSDEDYFPSSMEFYIENSGLILDGNEILVRYKALTPQTLVDSSVGYNPDRLSIDVTHSATSGVDPFAHPLRKVPMYVRVREVNAGDLGCKRIQITYFAFFPYNGATKILNCLCGVGAHRSDLEHMTIEFDKNGVPERVYFSAHNGGVWVPWREVRKSHDRPFGYLARWSHAFYPLPKCVPRIFCCIFDRPNGKGFRWDPDGVVAVTDESPVWNTYKGYLGFPDEGRMPRLKSYWDKETEESDTACGKICCPWNPGWRPSPPRQCMC